MITHQRINDKYVTLVNSLSLSRTLLTFLIVALLTGCGGDSTETASGPDPASLTLLTINLRNVMDTPPFDPAGNWMVRFDRIGSGLQADGLRPDIIALQEVNGWMWCTFDRNIVPDYTQLDYLLTTLANSTGIQYRIAYMTALTWSEGNFHESLNGTDLNACQAMSGLALLYNPQRIRNLMIDTPSADADSAFPHDYREQPGAHLRRSLPICNPAAGNIAESRIDGPVQMDKCNRETPGGLAWITSNAAALARLEFLERSGSVFHVYNIHPSHSGPHDGDVSAINAAVSALEDRFGAARWIPPIILGDFNTNETDPITYGDFPQFDLYGRAPGNDFIIAGKPASFPASASITGYASTELPRVPPDEGKCNSTEVMWSDHCAVLTRLFIQ